MENWLAFFNPLLQPTFPNWSTMNLKASMKKLEPSGLDLLDQMLVIMYFFLFKFNSDKDKAVRIVHISWLQHHTHPPGV